MARNGWDYLVIVRGADGHFRQPEDSTAPVFSAELEMLRQLGIVGWELIQRVDHEGDGTRYYFKRPRT